MIHMSVDLETYSDINLTKCGLYRYVESPNFEILLFAYAINDEPVSIIDLTQSILPDNLISMLFDPGVIKHAYNAAFEWQCLSKYFGIPRPEEWLPQWQCTMFHGLYCGYTAGLAATGKALELPRDAQKLRTGSALIRTFCVPCKPTKTNGWRSRTLPQHEPDRWKLFKEYCRQDVATERTIENKLSNFPVPEEEQQLWRLDQTINSRGVEIDTELVRSALSLNENIVTELTEEAKRISGITNPKSRNQLLEWLNEEVNEDEEFENLRKDTVQDAISKGVSSDNAQRILEIRQELGKASIAKYVKMEDAVCADSRVRGLFQHYGANRTGRWAGRLVQVQNLPRNYLPAINYARTLVRNQKRDVLSLTYGSIPDTLSQLIRTVFIPSIGNTFLVADFSAIEARVIAWLAKETWVMDVFASHGKIYEATASQMFGVPIDLIVKGNPEYTLRQKGKVATLALGYGGSSGALIKMGALNMGLTEEELPDIVNRWRAANKRIVDFWHKIENAAVETVTTGQPNCVNGVWIAREIDWGNKLDFMTITLPSKRKLFYAKPFLAENRFGNKSIHYYEVNGTTKKWSVSDTYGGKLTENIVQAIARDCLAVAMQRLESKRYEIVMHVHDEVIIDYPFAATCDALQNIYAIMAEPIEWAPGLLLTADGFAADFYKKE